MIHGLGHGLEVHLELMDALDTLRMIYSYTVIYRFTNRLHLHILPCIEKIISVSIRAYQFRVI
jgi:hypothetical protein